MLSLVIVIFSHCDLLSLCDLHSLQPSSLVIITALIPASMPAMFCVATKFFVLNWLDRMKHSSFFARERLRTFARVVS